MRLFLAYSGDHQPGVWDLINILDAADHEAWLDVWLLSSMHEVAQLRAALQNADAFLYVLTPNSALNERCRWELAEALQQGLPVVTILFTGDMHIPEALSAYPCVRFTAGPTPEAIAELLSLLHDIATISGPKALRDVTLPDPQASGGRIARLGRAGLVALLFVALSGVMRLMGVRLITDSSRAIARALPALYEVGVVAVFLLAFVLVSFTARYGALVHALFQGGLLVSYFSARQASFTEYVLCSGAALLAYIAGQSQLLFWPWLSYRIAQQHRQLKKQAADPAARAAIVNHLIGLLNQPVAFEPHGAQEAMFTLARMGVSLAAFSAGARGSIQCETYRGIVQQVGLEQLGQVETLDFMLDVIEQYELIPDSKLSVKVILHKIQRSTAQIEKLRIYAQFLQQMDIARQSMRRSQPANWQQQTRIYQTISDRVYRLVAPIDVSRYWLAYDALGATVEQIQSVIAAPQDVGEHPRHAILNALQQLGRLLELARYIELEVSQFPEREQEWYALIQRTELDARQLLSTDYQERQDLMTHEVQRLTVLAHSQPASWLAIDRSASQVTEHHNPWCVLTYLFLTHLEHIQKLDIEYVIWAEAEVSRILGEVESLNDIAELEQRLVDLTISGDSFGPMIDSTIQMIQEIGNATQAALDWPAETYHRRLALIDAQDKSNQLRNRLRTRYVSSRPREWADNIQQISEILDEYQDQQQVLEKATYQNPYIVGNPIPPRSATLFKGRRELARQIVTSLRSDNRPTLVLHGPRRMGKTSFLLQLQNLLRGWSNYIPVFLNGQEAGLRQSDASFFYFLARAIYVQMSQRTGQQIERPELAQFEASPYVTISTWLEDEIVPLLKPDEILLVTIDEFEKVGASIHAGELSVKVLDFLRHTMQHSEKLLFLFCGVQTLEALGPDSASYFISVQAVEIGYLSDAEAEELIRNPSPEVGTVPAYNRDVVAEIIRLTNGQPFLIQAICSQIIDIANERHLQRITRHTLKDALPTLYTKYRMYFQNIWDDADKEGQSLLSRLANGPAELTREEMGGPVGQGLLKRSVVYQRPDNLYQIEIPLVERWVDRQT